MMWAAMMSEGAYKPETVSLEDWYEWKERNCLLVKLKQEDRAQKQEREEAKKRILEYQKMVDFFTETKKLISKSRNNYSKLLELKHIIDERKDWLYYELYDELRHKAFYTLDCLIYKKQKGK